MRSRHSSRLPVLLLLTVLAACHPSGTWVDDPNNFKRAWGQSPPAGVDVRHSWYWRSAHFTREEAYYFEFGRNPELMRGFIAENRLLRTDAAVSIDLSKYSCFARPTWFAPKPMGAYTAWVTPPNASPALILEDRITGDFFLAGCQL